MITYQIESYRKTRENGLIEMHYQEIASDKDAIPLDPEWETYDALEDSGNLVCITVRDAGVLIGYAVFILRWHLHYRTTRFAANDVIYVHPDYRKGTTIGRDLILRSEKELREYGVDKIQWHVKCYKNWSPILRRMGYVNEEVLCTKLIRS